MLSVQCHTNSKIFLVEVTSSLNFPFYVLRRFAVTSKFFNKSRDVSVPVPHVGACYKTVYGASPTNAQIVTRFYDNVLGRATDLGGLMHWVTILDSGNANVAQVLASFSESPENQAAVIGVIGNGILYTPYG